MTGVRWGLLATAEIGSVVVNAAHEEFAAVASRSAERARRFADEHGLGASFGSYEELLASDEIDAVYIALPNTLHAGWAVKALEAGKHVLCEKPFATVPDEVESAFDVAAQRNLVCAEGFMYRHHPRTALVRRLVADGAIGRLRYVRAALTAGNSAGDVRRQRDLGGGALFDRGCYCVSAARMFAGEPERVFGEAVCRDAEVDLTFTATMRHPGGVLTQFDAAMDAPRRDELELLGSDGRIVVPDPWLCRTPAVELHRDEVRTLTVDARDVYRIEIEAVSAAISDGVPLEFGKDDAVAQARVLDALRRSSEKGEPVTFGA